MSEKMNFRPENKAEIESLKPEFDDVIFEEKIAKGGVPEYRSSAPDRKMITLSPSSLRPEPGIPYRVRVVEDTNPADQAAGKFLVEIIPLETNSIVETETTVSYLGVALEKAKNLDSQFVPRRESYADFINDKEVALPLQRDMAVAFLSGEPLLVDGGTSLGKTTTVRKMAAELGWEVHYANLNGATDVEDLMGRYIPNPHKSKPEDPEYIFADGKVTSGLRQEEGKTKIVILDEFNASAPNILIRLHEVLDALERGGEVILSEDASEALVVDKNKTKVIALMNPPGKGYFGREPLDPAQLRRWVYKKMPSELPAGTFSYATNALFGVKQEAPHITPDMFLQARDQALTPEQLPEIPGIQEILGKYREFHEGSKQLLKSRKIAEDQPQPFTYDDRMEPRRVRDFVLRFYKGNVNETFQQALKYYYANKLESESDRKKLTELIRMVEAKPQLVDSKRKGLEVGKKAKVVAKEPGLIAETESSLERGETPYLEAKRIMGEDFFDASDLTEAFGVINENPPIPFSIAELERAHELGQQLILYVDKAPDGTPLSIFKINQIRKGKAVDGDPLLYSSDGKDGIKDDAWYKSEAFVNEAPRVGWRLTAKEPIPDSTSKNYLQQTELLINYLANEVYKGSPLPAEYQVAIEEFNKKKSEIGELMRSDWQKASLELSNLAITNLTRELPVEVIYRLTVAEVKNRKKSLASRYTWTAARTSDGTLVYVGSFDSKGANVYRLEPSRSHEEIGVCLSRS